MAMNPNEFDDFLEDDDTPDQIVDTRADGRLLRVPLGRIAPNLINPRTDFGTTEQLEDFGRSLKRRQIQAVPVVTRRAYLELWPEHKDQIGNVDFVIVSGERRYRAATAVALPALECVINDGYAESRKTFLDAVVSENIDRQNFDAIEEANAVEVLVEAFGSARSVAEHYERVDGWVSQRRILLRLASEVQELVRRQQMPLEPARKLGKLVKDHQWDAAAQLQWWEQEQRDRAAKAAAKKAARAAARQPRAASQASPDTPVFTAVKPEPDAAAASPEPRESPAPVVVPAETRPVAVPEPRDQEPAPRTPWVYSGNSPEPAPARPEAAPTPVAEPSAQAHLLPTHDPRGLFRLLRNELSKDDRHELTRLMMQVMTRER